MNTIDITNITSGKDKREYVSALENVRNYNLHFYRKILENKVKKMLTINYLS